MKRKFLEDLGLEKDSIDKIMTEYGKSVEKSKADIENLQSEVTSKENLLKEVNSEIEKYKGMDIEGIKKSAEDWKAKYENDTKAFQEQLKQKDYDHAVNQFISAHKFSNDFVKNAFIEDFKKQGLKLGEDNKFLGADDYIKTFGEKNPGVFTTEKEPFPKVVAPTSGTQEPSNGFNFNFTPIRKINK